MTMIDIKMRINEIRLEKCDVRMEILNKRFENVQLEATKEAATKAKNNEMRKNTPVPKRSDH